MNKQWHPTSQASILQRAVYETELLSHMLQYTRSCSKPCYQANDCGWQKKKGELQTWWNPWQVHKLHVAAALQVNPPATWAYSLSKEWMQLWPGPSGQGLQQIYLSLFSLPELQTSNLLKVKRSMPGVIQQTWGNYPAPPQMKNSNK